MYVANLELFTLIQKIISPLGILIPIKAVFRAL